MPYVIFNKQTNKYIKHPSTWVGRLSKATKFKTEENASNFLSCPPRALALPPIEAIAILSTDNLTDIYNTSYSFTEETAQQEFEELKSFLSDTLSSFDKLAFCNVSASDGYKLYKQLQEIRIRRRNAKDHLEIASLVLSTGLLASMKTLDNEIKAVETNMADRKYKPRVLVGLFDDSGITEIEEESEEDVTTETEREETA